jgi:AraC-like DNA-binding protein
MNRKQLYRKVKALTNQTPNEYIRSIRLQQAAQLLRTRQFTIAEVTYRVGFQDLKYFRERFRDFYGVNPSEII